MTPEIDVVAAGEKGAVLRFNVRVRDRGGETRHRVTLARGDYERLGGDAESPDEFVSRCFEFLLEREPKESILATFDIGVISRYFPEFERAIARG